MTGDENSDDVTLWDIDLKCRACKWEGISKDTDTHFRESIKKVLMVCPRCKTIDYFEVINEKKES